MNSRNCPVDVISVCSAEGEITPLRLRLEDEERQWLRIDIDQVVKHTVVQTVGVEAHVFLCRATVHSRQWLFELRYIVCSHCWQLRKI